jgi:hypothetical protein
VLTRLPKPPISLEGDRRCLRGRILGEEMPSLFIASVVLVVAALFLPKMFALMGWRAAR